MRRFSTFPCDPSGPHCLDMPQTKAFWKPWLQHRTASHPNHPNCNFCPLGFGHNSPTHYGRLQQITTRVQDDPCWLSFLLWLGVEERSCPNSLASTVIKPVATSPAYQKRDPGNRSWIWMLDLHHTVKDPVMPDPQGPSAQIWRY